MKPIRIATSYGPMAYLVSAWGTGFLLLSLSPFYLVSGVYGAVLFCVAILIGTLMLAFDWLIVPRRLEFDEEIRVYSHFLHLNTLKWTDIVSTSYERDQSFLPSGIKYLPLPIDHHELTLHFRDGEEAVLFLRRKDVEPIRYLFEQMLSRSPEAPTAATEARDMLGTGEPFTGD